MKNMWFLISVLAFVNAEVRIENNNDSVQFHKCCPENENLIKINEMFGEKYTCMNSDTIEEVYGASISGLKVGKHVTLIEGMPEGCVYRKVTQAEEDASMTQEICYDKLILEITNDTITHNIPKIIVLTCENNETDVTPITQRSRIQYFRKCCPDGEVYDFVHHMCRNMNSNAESLIQWINESDYYVFDTEIGLHCKSDEYSVELREEMFSLSVKDSVLTALDKRGYPARRLAKGQWCIDHSYGSSQLVARACTRDCSDFRVFCLRKCCPIGQHYKTRRCGSLSSVCVPNVDITESYNVTHYLDPLRGEPGFSDLLGIRTDLHCPKGRYALSEAPRDRHRLTPEGMLETENMVSGEYCFETFDRRHCNDTLLVSAALCFVDYPPVKDFHVSFVFISISSVCLALTLLVYCSVPELRNLHGRNLICHVSMMLFAYTCLARVQYGTVENRHTCTMLGYFIYFGFVAAFTWLNVMCFDIWWTFGTVRTVQPLRKASAERRRFIWYSLYAWSVALLLTIVMFLLDIYPVADFLDANMGNGICWFGSMQNTLSDVPHYIFFVVPMGLVTCTNFILWVLTARHCARVKSEVHRLQAGSVGDRAKRHFRMDRANFVLTGKLWVVMGAGWICELLSTIASEPKWLWFIVDLINELQGVFIFVILVFKPKLYYLIRKRLGLEKPHATKNGTTSSGRTSSTILSRTISTDERTNHRVSLPENPKKA